MKSLGPKVVRSNPPLLMSSEKKSETGTEDRSRKPNRLIHESSPYLQQHAWNPVDWYPWGEDALELARRENRLIFLSIGYSSCHWCHVMERESFENPQMAHLLNENFVNIKVDREERPDVDAVYMEALQMMTGQGGWPLNIWLTPDQVPVFAGTYFPPRDLHGRPGFPSVVTRLAEIYRQQPDKVRKQAAEMHKALANDLYDHLSPGPVTPELLDRACEQHAAVFDKDEGGFSSAPKFPTAMGIGFLLRYSHEPGSAQARHMALFSLEKMISGGIYDQIGGGFHRYSTDHKWLVPHFEKMLYDNALLLPVLAEACQITGEPVFAQTVDETIRFLNREMRHPEGAYYSALDADTEGVEGKFYTFTYEELRQLLDPENFSLVADHYGIESGGNREDVNVLHRAVPLEQLARRYDTNTESLQIRLETVKKKLLDYRNRRVRPGLDDKIITSWNALMLIALCRCARLLDKGAEDAIRLGAFLAEKALCGNILYRIIDRDGKTKQPGFLDDYALLADGYSRLFEFTGETRWLSLSVKLIRLMIDQFHDAEKAAFSYAPKNREPLVARTRDVFDNAQPGGTTAAITALYRVGHLAGVPEWTRMAVSAMEPLAEMAAKHATAFGYMLQTMHLNLFPGREIVIAQGSGASEDRVTREMLGIWRENYDPSSWLIVLPAQMPQDPSGPAVPAHPSDPGSESTNIDLATLYRDKTALQDRTTAYVCKNFACRAPVQTPDDFRKEIGAKKL